jgi:branched-chain amino acid transport system permease protein
MYGGQEGGLSARKGSAQGRMLFLVLAVGVCAALAATAPSFLSQYWIRILSSICMFAAVAQSINIITGFVGYPAFGNVVFFGLGAYGTAVLVTQYHWPSMVALGAGALLCAVLVLIVGPPVLRLRGHYFAIATLGLNETMKAITVNLTGLTGGGMGLSLPIPGENVAISARNFYWMFLALAFLSIAVAIIIRSTRFGYACRAILANEEGADSLGINTTYYKTAAWLVSAVIAGIAGGLYALWIGYIDAPSVFDMTIAVKGFVMFLIGGPGTILGPLVGAVLVELAANLTWSNLLQYHLAVLGLIIMAAAILMPKRVPQQIVGRFLRMILPMRRGT